jgi:hypothetical protein
MSDESAFHIFMNHPMWDEPYIAVATSRKQVADIIGKAVREYMEDRDFNDLDVHVIYGVPVETKVQAKDISVVQLEAEKFLVGVDEDEK